MYSALNIQATWWNIDDTHVLVETMQIHVEAIQVKHVKRHQIHLVDTITLQSVCTRIHLMEFRYLKQQRGSRTRLVCGYGWEGERESISYGKAQWIARAKEKDIANIENHAQRQALFTNVTICRTIDGLSLRTLHCNIYFQLSLYIVLFVRWNRCVRNPTSSLLLFVFFFLSDRRSFNV